MNYIGVLGRSGRQSFCVASRKNSLATIVIASGSLPPSHPVRSLHRIWFALSIASGSLGRTIGVKHKKLNGLIVSEFDSLLGLFLQ
jgi:hypothetical protein